MLRLGLTGTVIALASAAWPWAASGGDFPGASGMAALDETHYLCVQDRKARDEGSCIGILSIDPAARIKRGEAMVSYEGLELGNWQGERASDLEAICRLPGKELRFIACESGYFADGAGKDHFGRLFVLQAKQGKHGWRVRREQTLQLPKWADEIEGVACAAAADGRMLLIVGERGGKGDGAPGKLHWGWLADLEAAQDGAAPPVWGKGEMSISNPFNAAYPAARPVSDLYLDELGNLWTASAFDPDQDCGPFVSAIWAVASVNPDDDHPLAADNLADQSWLMEGLKIEAIGAPRTRGSALCFATDDEGFGGIWRPLGPPTDFDDSSLDSEEAELLEDDEASEQ